MSFVQTVKHACFYLMKVNCDTRACVYVLIDYYIQVLIEANTGKLSRGIQTMGAIDVAAKFTLK